MKKIFLSIVLFSLLSLIFIPVIANAALVPPPCCGGNEYTLCDFFTMLSNIYEFIVKMIATPLAVIALIVGGIMMMISAGNPQLFSKGKQILVITIIGLVLVFASWMIVDVILKTLGFTGDWSTGITNCECQNGDMCVL